MAKELTKQEKEITEILKKRECVECGHCEDKNGKKVFPCVMYESVIDRRG